MSNNEIVILDSTRRNWGEFYSCRASPNTETPFFELFCELLSSKKICNTLILVHLSDIAASVDVLSESRTFMESTKEMSNTVSVIIYSGDADKVTVLRKKLLLGGIINFNNEKQFVFYPVSVSHEADAYKEFKVIIEEWKKGKRALKEIVDEKIDDVVWNDALDAFRLLLHLALLKRLSNEAFKNSPTLLNLKLSLGDDDIFWNDIWKAFSLETMKEVIDRFDNDSRFDKSGEKNDLLDCMTEIVAARQNNITKLELDGYCLNYLEYYLSEKWRLSL